MLEFKFKANQIFEKLNSQIYYFFYPYAHSLYHDNQYIALVAFRPDMIGYGLVMTS